MSKLIQVEFFCSSVSARNDLRIIFIAVGCLFLWSCGLHNQDMGIRLDQSRAIDKLIQQKQANFHIPGFAIAVIKNGSVVKKITLGLANAEAGIPVTDSTSFQLASTTKSFTATAIMTLVQDGRLRLTDSVGSILKGLPQSWQKVTVRQLLSHTSGLPDITLREGKIDLVSNTWDSSLKIIYNQPFQFAPGEKWAYDQTGYVLLSLIAEKISGMSFSKFMTETLFNKLGMRHTFFDPPTGINNSLAANYEIDGENKLVKRDLSFASYVRPAGGLWSSLDDLIRWDAAFDSDRILKPDLVKTMWTSVPLNNGSVFRIDRKTMSYGLGWVVDDAPNHWAVGHSGGNSTAVRKFLDEHFTIIVLHNGVCDPDELIESIATIMRSEPGEAEATPQVRLWEAAKSGDTAEIISAIKDKADIELLDTRKSGSGRRALNWAAWFNHPEAIRVLLKHGAQIDAENKTGFTALHHAAEAGSLQAAKALLEAGADPGHKNRSGRRPAEIAISQNHTEVANLINSVKANNR